MSNLLKATIACGSYMVVSLVVVFFNNHIMKSTMKLPVFVTMVQNAVSLVALLAIIRLKRVFPKLLSFLPDRNLNWKTAKKIIPLSVFFVLMLAFNNFCLKVVQISTYQVARSSTILFNLIISYIVLGTKFSILEAVSCGVVTMGLVVGALDPESLSFLGVATGTIGSVFWALYSVNVKRSLNDVDQWSLSLYNNLISLPLFLPAIYFAGEADDVFQLPHDLESVFSLWLPVLLSGMFAFAMNIVVFYCINLTSPVTYNIVGTVKACLQSLGGIIFLGELVTPQSALGIILCIVGSFSYTLAKQQPTKNKEDLEEAKKEK